MQGELDIPFLDNGYLYNGFSKTRLLYVRAVRGQQLSQKFIDNNDGTVTDSVTGLMWQQDSTEYPTWDSALSYCEHLTLAGYNDWRMPDENELVVAG